MKPTMIMHRGTLHERCCCGNLVPVGRLTAGLCVACVCEAQEKVAREAKAARLCELQDRYLSQNPFYAYMPKEDE